MLNPLSLKPNQSYNSPFIHSFNSDWRIKWSLNHTFHSSFNSSRVLQIFIHPFAVLSFAFPFIPPSPLSTNCNRSGRQNVNFSDLLNWSRISRNFHFVFSLLSVFPPFELIMSMGAIRNRQAKKNHFCLSYNYKEMGENLNWFYWWFSRAEEVIPTSDKCIGVL